MKITFFRFNVEPQYWEAVEKFLKNNDVGEVALRQCLKHCTTNFIIEQSSRYAADQITDCRDVYSHQSLRYVNFKNRLEKSQEDFFSIPQEVLDKGQIVLYRDSTNDLINRYCKLVDAGIPPEDARFILPGSFFSNIKITLHGDKLLDFVLFNYYKELREHKEILDEFLNQFRGKYDILVDKLMNVVKAKEDEYKNIQNAENLWMSVLKPGQFSVFYHNNPVLETSLGASICYRGGAPSEYIESFDSEKQETLIKKIIASKHESTTEHAYYTIQCSLSRAIHQQLRRHRIPARSYTSICDAADNYSFVTPPTIKADKECNRIFEEGMNKAKAVYDTLINAGVYKEAAAYILPNAIRLDIVLTTNLRDIKHILKERLCERAQWEIRELAYKIFEALYTKSPLLFSDLGPSCYIGKCKEGDFCCGKPHIFKEFVTGLKETAATKE